MSRPSYADWVAQEKGPDGTGEIRLLDPVNETPADADGQLSLMIGASVDRLKLASGCLDDGRDTQRA